MASIIKRAGRPKPWLVQWREPETKAQRWMAFVTKREAEAFRDTVSTDLRQGTYQSLKPTPFSEWATGWLERRRPAVSPNTAALYEWAVQRLTAAFGRTPIQNLRAEQIESWQAKLLQEGKLSRRSVQTLRITLGTILADARKKRLHTNPMEAVELPPVLVPFLLAHRERQNGGPNPHALVFCTGEGTPLDGRNVRRRHFQPALKRLGTSGIRPHDLRRTFIAMHVEAGTHPKLVQERVGHSDVRLTMDTYAELAGKMALPADQASRFNGLAAKVLPDPGKHLVNTTP